MKKEIEIFEFLRAKSTIKKIDIDDLYSLLADAQKGKRYKNYTIKMINTGAILIHDSNNNTNTLLPCIKDICNKLPASCTMIRTELGAKTAVDVLTGTDVPNCSKCYMRYIEKLKNGEF